MAFLGVVMLAIGLLLLVVEAHVSSPGVFAGLGALSTSVGLGVLLVSAGTALAVAVPAAVGAAGCAAVAGVITIPRVTAARRLPIQAGPQRLVGKEAVVRHWDGAEGQVEADGGLWRARLEPIGADDGPPSPGDAVIIERIRGLTLAVRRREPWEIDLV